MRFVYPLDMENAYGQVMLNILLARGMAPEMVIEEDSPEAEDHRNRWTQRLAGRNLAPSVASQVDKYRLQYAKVANLSSHESERIIRDQEPDLIVIGGTIRLIKKNIFPIARWGTLVSHPGLLPHIRGVASVAWSIYEDINVGCSCIIVDEGIDTGPILKTRIVPVHYLPHNSSMTIRSLV